MSIHTCTYITYIHGYTVHIYNYIIEQVFIIVHFKALLKLSKKGHDFRSFNSFHYVTPVTEKTSKSYLIAVFNMFKYKQISQIAYILCVLLVLQEYPESCDCIQTDIKCVEVNLEAVPLVSPNVTWL